ncbi:hypothetical protein PG985_015069 [Apiospora marii]|uniref:Uncharacterized protein n=1 Tax=Apiospora marii TaxID=335849 RepID=A0ABR1RM29_9PEZI
MAIPLGPDVRKCLAYNEVNMPSYRVNMTTSLNRLAALSLGAKGAALAAPAVVASDLELVPLLAGAVAEGGPAGKVAVVEVEGAAAAALGARLAALAVAAVRRPLVGPAGRALALAEGRRARPEAGLLGSGQGVELGGDGGTGVGLDLIVGID